MTRPFSILTLTSLREHLLLAAPDESTIARLKDTASASESHVCEISEHLPLLANLNVLENVALGSMYHNHMSLTACLDKLEPAFALLKLEGIMDQRQQFLSKAQRLKVQLLRCIANGSGFILLDSPKRSDCDILERALATLDEQVFLWVCCLSTDKDVYTPLGYTTIDLDDFA